MVNAEVKENEVGEREEGRGNKEGEGGEGRRARSWSPKKEDVLGSSEREEEDEPRKEGDKETEKGGNAFQRFLGLRRTSLPTSSTPNHPSACRLSLRKSKPKKALQFASPPAQIPPPSSASRSSTPPFDSQAMYDQKRLRREQRRSYRSSEDYLTISGANPRTGYWDVNTAIGSTSSSEAANRAQQREMEIAENRRRLESAKQELEEALGRREAEDREREVKRARRREREEAKRKEKRNREAGRWKAEGGGWTMVVEPGLSPIVQSLAGSPRTDRTPDDQLTEMRVPSEIVEGGGLRRDSGRDSGREGEGRGGNDEERARMRENNDEGVRRRLSRSPATPSRLSRQVGDTSAEPALSTPVGRKALPSASRVVSGDIPLYVASPSRKGGSSRKVSNDRVPELQPGLPPPALERANPARAAIFPSPRRQPYRPLFIDAGPETPPQGKGSPVVSTERSVDNRKEGHGNASPNEPVRRNPDRANHDPFGPIPRRRPASPLKVVNIPQPAGLETHSTPGTPQLVETTPVRGNEADLEPVHAAPVVVPSGVEAENRELEGSNDTIVRHSIVESLPEALPPADRPRIPSSTRKDLNERESQIIPEQSPFLGIRPEGQPEEPATATSSPSDSTSPALIHHPSHQSLKVTNQGKRIKHIVSMNELPPFVVKDPVTGTSLPIVPSSPKILEEVANRSSKETTIGGGGKEASIITTTTTTPTTGSAPGPPLLDQMDGGFEPRPSPLRRPTQLSRIPAPRVSPQSARTHLPSSGLSPRRGIGSATLLAGGATPPTKRRMTRWYQRLLPGGGGGGGGERNTLISISTSPDRISPDRMETSPRYHLGDPGGHPGAQNAARVALLNGDKALNSGLGVVGQRAGVGAGVSGGSPGGSPRGGNEMGRGMGSPVRNGRDDRLVVWHSSPVPGLRKRNDAPGGADKKNVATSPPTSSTPKPDTSPGGATLQQVLLVLLLTTRHLILTSWHLVEPVFDPKSALRARWERQELTWRDGVVVAGAGVFAGAALMAAVLCGRVVGVLVRIGGVVGRIVG